MLGIKQARLPTVHADLKRGKRHRLHVGIHILLMNGDELCDTHAPIAFIPLDDGCFPYSGKHTFQLAAAPHIGVIAWVRYGHPVGDHFKGPQVDDGFIVLPASATAADIGALPEDVAQHIGIASEVIRVGCTGGFIHEHRVAGPENPAGFLFHFIVGDPEDTLPHRHEKTAGGISLADGIAPDQFAAILPVLLLPKPGQGGIRATVLIYF